MNEEYLKHVNKEILELIDSCEKNSTRIYKKDLSKRMNSYEWNLCLHYLSNEYLIETAKYYIEQAFSEFRRTEKYTINNSYNDTLKHKLIHILIKRLEEKK